MAITKKMIQVKLTELGISHDAAAAKADLAALLNPETLASLEPPPPPPAPLFLCEVLRDYWPTENEADRVRTGAIVEVDAETAMDGIERGVLARVK